MTVPATHSDAHDAAPESRSVALRSRILEEAARLFAEKGYAATAMREVAEATGCTKPALYYHFDSKGALFLEVIRDETQRIASLLTEQLERAETVRERMRRAMRAYFQHARDNPIGLRLLVRAELHREKDQPDFDFHSSRQMYTDMVVKLLAEGVRAGEIRDDIDLRDAMLVLAGAVDQCVIRWILHKEPIDEGYPERVLALLFGGMAP
jgi:AcrR family transcriptional regulator